MIDWVAAHPADVMRVHGPTYVCLAQAAATRNTAPVTTGSSNASMTCCLGMTSRCPGVTGSSGTMTIDVASSDTISTSYRSVSTMSQKTQNLLIGRARQLERPEWMDD